jgi:hypothetical protein
MEQNILCGKPREMVPEFHMTPAWRSMACLSVSLFVDDLVEMVCREHHCDIRQPGGYAIYHVAELAAGDLQNHERRFRIAVCSNSFG